MAEKAKGEVLKNIQNNNWAQSLEGKVAGLKIQSTGAVPLGSFRISLRGEKPMRSESS